MKKNRPPAKKPQPRKPAPRRAAKPTTPAPKPKVPSKPAAKAPSKSAPAPARSGKGKPAPKPKVPGRAKSPAPVTVPAAPAKPARKRKAPAPAPESTAASPTPPPPAPSPAPSPPPVVVSAADTDLDEVEAPGEAIDGKRFATAILYAAKVTPKEDPLVFTRDAVGRPLISGHDLRRCHTAYLGQDAAFHLDASVPRADAAKLAKAILGLTASMVRVAADGEVLIRHGVAQPPMRFRLGTRAITQRWQPPSQEGNVPAGGALRIQASWQAAACRWSDAIVHTWQSASGIEWCTLTDNLSGELLARAVLAEDGKDLFPEDDRQQEIPGSRTAGGGHLGMGTPAPRPVAAPPAAPPPSSSDVSSDEEPAVLVDGEPVTSDDVAVPESPAVDDTSDTRVWIPLVVWDDLSPDAQVALTNFVEPGSIVSEETDGWLRADVAGPARRALAKVAGEYDVTLHWGDAPPRTNATGEGAAGDVRVWVRESDWDALNREDYDAVDALLDEGAFGDVPEGAPEGWVTSLVLEGTAPGFRKLALRLGLAFEEGATPPGVARAPATTGDAGDDDADEAEGG